MRLGWGLRSSSRRPGLLVLILGRTAGRTSYQASWSAPGEMFKARAGLRSNRLKEGGLGVIGRVRVGVKTGKKHGYPDHEMTGCRCIQRLPGPRSASAT